MDGVEYWAGANSGDRGDCGVDLGDSRRVWCGSLVKWSWVSPLRSSDTSVAFLPDLRAAGAETSRDLLFGTSAAWAAGVSWYLILNFKDCMCNVELESDFQEGFWTSKVLMLAMWGGENEILFLEAGGAAVYAIDVKDSQIFVAENGVFRDGDICERNGC